MSQSRLGQLGRGSSRCPCVSLLVGALSSPVYPQATDLVDTSQLAGRGVAFGLAKTDYGVNDAKGVVDFDGEGFDDFALAAPELYPKKVYLIRGGSPLPPLLDLAEPGALEGHAVVFSSQPVFAGREQAAGIGDINGDGSADLLLGLTQRHDEATYLFYGRPDLNPPVHVPPLDSLPLPGIPPHLESTTSFTQPFPPGPSAPAGPAAAPGPASTEDSEFLRKRKRSWTKLISKVYLDDPSLCRSCGKPMKIIAATAPKQEDVIERIPRCLDLWDAPWRRQRKTRGPPSSSRAGSTDLPTLLETTDRIIDDEIYAVDPAAQEGEDPPA